MSAPEDLMPIPEHLFKPDEKYTTLDLIPATLEKLQSIKGPVSLICVVGTQRGGKSTLLNLLHARKTSGFGVGHHLTAQTMGLWICTRKHPRNEDMTVILMDTEGLDSPHVPQWYNWMLAAVALLISSVFIYQSKSSIDSSAIDRLGVILKVAEQLGGSGDPSTDKPNFIWLIRDHQLMMKKSPKAELTEKLDAGALKALTKCFTEYDCVVLPRPVDRDDLLKDVEKLSYEELRTDFREEYVVLEKSLFKMVENPRKLSGRVVTGELLGSMISKYAEAVSSKAGIITELSQLPTQHQMVIRMAAERATKEGVKEYQKLISELEKKLPVGSNELSAAHNEAYNSALNVFNKEALVENGKMEPDILEYFKEFNKKVSDWQPSSSRLGSECLKIDKLVGGIYFSIWTKNFELSSQKSKSEIDRLYQPIKKQLSSVTSENQFTEQVEELKKQYSQSTEAIGIAKEEIFEKFLKEQVEKDSERVRLTLLENLFLKKLGETQEQLKQMQTEFSNQQASLSSKVEENKQSIEKKLVETSQQTNEQLSKQANSLEQIRESQANENKNNSEKLNNLQSQITKLETPIALNTQLINTVQEKLTTFQQESTKNAQTQQKKLDQLEERSNRSEAANSKLSEEIKQTKNDVTNGFSNANNQLTNVQSQVAGNTQRLDELRTVSEKIQTESKFQQELVNSKYTQLEQSLQNESKSNQERSSNLQSHLTRVETTLSSGTQQITARVEEQIKSIKDEISNITNSTIAKLSESEQRSRALLDSLSQKIGEVSEKSLKEQETRIKSIEGNLAQQFGSIQDQTTRLTTDLTTIRNSISESEQRQTQSLQSSITQLNELKANVNEQLSGFAQSSQGEVQRSVSQLQSNLESIERKTTQSSDSVRSELSTKVDTIKQQLESLQQHFATQLDTVSTQLTKQLEESKPDQFMGDLSKKVDSKIAALNASAKDLQKGLLLTEEISKHFEHVKQSVDAIWGSIGTLSGRIVDIEAMLDKTTSIKFDKDAAERTKSPTKQ